MHEHRGSFLAARRGDGEGGDVALLEAGKLLDRPFDVLRPVVAAVDDDAVAVCCCLYIPRRFFSNPPTQILKMAFADDMTTWKGYHGRIGFLQTNWAFHRDKDKLTMM